MPHNRFWNLLAKKLAGEAVPDELNELEQLMKLHPELVYSVEQIETMWKSGGRKPDHQLASIAFENHLNKLAEEGITFPLEENEKDNLLPPKKNSILKRILIISVFASTLLIAGYLWLNNDKEALALPAKKISEVSTNMGSKSTKLILPDSSIVWLNAGSKITYGENFGNANRNTVLSGEAFFDVKKSNIPFVIHANGIQVKVLGTAFNVKSYPDEKTTETSLVRGKIEISLDRRPGEIFILKPNEKLIVSNQPPTPKETTERKKEAIVVLSGLTTTIDNTVVETSWVDNKLVFQDESFSDLARKLERWYGVTIEINNKKLESERFTGTFTSETIREALEVLQIITPFQFSLKSNSIVITR